MRTFKISVQVLEQTEAKPGAVWADYVLTIQAPGEFQALIEAGGALRAKLGYPPRTRRVGIEWAVPDGAEV